MSVISTPIKKTDDLQRVRQHT